MELLLFYKETGIVYFFFLRPRKNQMRYPGRRERCNLLFSIEVSWGLISPIFYLNFLLVKFVTSNL